MQKLESGKEVAVRKQGSSETYKCWSTTNAYIEARVSEGVDSKLGVQFTSAVPEKRA